MTKMGLSMFMPAATAVDTHRKSFVKLVGGLFELICGEPALVVRGLFKADDFVALPALYSFHKMCGVKQRLAGTLIEPSQTATQALHTQVAPIQVGLIDACNFQLAASGWLHGLGISITPLSQK